MIIIISYDKPIGDFILEFVVAYDSATSNEHFKERQTLNYYYYYYFEVD